MFAASEERYQRIKSTGGFPANAIDACLRHAGIDASDIDYVAFAGTRAIPVNMVSSISTFSKADQVRIQEELRRRNFYEKGKPKKKLSDLFRDFEPKGKIGYDFERVGLRESWELTPEEKQSIGEYRAEFAARYLGIPKHKIHFVDHHTCHAYYAYYASPFRNQPTLSATMDAGGDGIYDSVNFFSESGEFQRLHASHESIIGPLYTYITLLLGMKPFEHEFKVMGLAPYSKAYERQEPLAYFMSRLSLDGIKFRNTRPDLDLYIHARQALQHSRFDGIAGALQEFTEHFLTKWITEAARNTKASNVTFSGGVALNVKASKNLTQIPEVRKLFIPPGAGDESLPIGACWRLQDELATDSKHREHIEPLSNAYLGGDFGDAEIEEFATHKNVKGQFSVQEGNPDVLAAKDLADGKIVAACRGRMEFGPRALGHRSILANPSLAETTKLINEAIKSRDFWMPFAPAVLAEDLDAYFSGTESGIYDFMTIAADSTSEGRSSIFAALHPYDLTGRPQSVCDKHSPLFHATISEFKKVTGIGGVLNTSLNYHGKPIVDHPVQIADEMLSQKGVTFGGMIVGSKYFARTP